MPSSIWTLKSLVLFLNAGKRKKKSNELNLGRKTAKSLLRRNRKSDEDAFEEVVLNDEIWSIICDYSSPMDVLRLRRVNRQLNRVVQQRLNSLIYFDVLRCDSAGELVENNPENEFHRVDKKNLYLHWDERSVIVVVDQRWTTRDIQAIWGAIQFFAPYARSLTIDSPLVELVAAALSSIKLTRFYAFICYVNAVGSGSHDELHIKCTKKTVHQKSLFPKLTELTIRTTPNDLCCLSRLSDYGVQFDAICSRELVELVRCALLEPMGRVNRTERGLSIRMGAKRPHHHLRDFKTWIGSDELKEKYVQQYSN